MSDHPKMHGEAAASASWRQMLDERQRKAIAFAEQDKAEQTHLVAGRCEPCRQPFKDLGVARVFTLGCLSM